MSDEISAHIRERAKLPPLERAVSNALDKYLWQVHGSMTSWAHPVEFIQFLQDEGFEIVEVTND